MVGSISRLATGGGESGRIWVRARCIYESSTEAVAKFSYIRECCRQGGFGGGRVVLGLVVGENYAFTRGSAGRRNMYPSSG